MKHKNSGGHSGDGAGDGKRQRPEETLMYPFSNSYPMPKEEINRFFEKTIITCI